MHLQTIFELSMVLDSEKFNKIFTRAYNKSKLLGESEGEYIDHTLASKGITISYRDTRHKKKVKLIVNQDFLMYSEEMNPDKLIRKLERQIGEYFGAKYEVNDFVLSGMVLTTDINVGGHGKVAAYLKVLRRIGKVKGFSPSSYEALDATDNFCLDGNSNATTFLIYDLKGLLTSPHRKIEFNRKKFKSILENSEGILRAEVRLTKPKTIRAYTDEFSTSKQIMALSAGNQEIFLDTFMKVIPYGDFFKKDKAIEIIRKEVKDNPVRRRMLRLLALIPEKKSLWLAQKEMEHRNIEKVMDAFAKINLSPVTISKRHEEKRLKNLYDYIEIINK